MKSKVRHEQSNGKHADELGRLLLEQERERARDFSTRAKPFRDVHAAESASVPTRKDHKYVPARYEDTGTGTLAGPFDPDATLEGVSTDEALAALNVALAALAPLACAYGSPASEQEWDALSDDLVRRVLAMQTTARGSLGWKKKIQKAHEQLLGYAPGERWTLILERALWADKYNRENLRRNPAWADSRCESREAWENGERRGPLPTWRETTDRELLEWIRTQADVPSELTAEVLGGMRARVSMGGGGGRGDRVQQSPKRLVEAFKNRDALAKKRKRRR